MIIKGQSRGRAAQLAKHLLNARDNEDVRLHESRGTIAQTVEGALAEMEAQGARSRSKKMLYHASVSPRASEPMNASQLGEAVELLERKLGFVGQPRIVVVHRKEGREHAHIVWSRIDRAGRTISDSWNYVRHEEVARELEQRFSHTRVQGIHTDRGPRPRRKRMPKEYEERQAVRSGVDPQEIRRDLSEAWSEVGSGEDFQAAIEAKGYRLVRGDRRGFVVLDRAGEAHSLARVLGIETRALFAKFSRQQLANLPTVEGARAQLKRARSHQKQFMVRTFSVQSGPKLTALPLGTSRQHFASRRASVVSEFASKIAAACGSSANREEVTARIQRLRDEEAATLSAITREAQGSNTHIRMAYRSAARELSLRRPAKNLANQSSNPIKPS